MAAEDESEFNFKNDSNLLDGIPTPKKKTLIGLYGAQVLLAQKITIPHAHAHVYSSIDDMNLSNRYLCLYGPEGSGVRTLVTGYCKDMRLNLKIVTHKLDFTSIFAWIKNNMPCVILFDKCEHFRKSPVRSTATSDFFDQVQKNNLPSKGIWFIWSPGMLPTFYFDDYMLSKIGSRNWTYLHPLNKKDRGQMITVSIIKHLKERMLTPSNNLAEIWKSMEKYMDSKDRFHLMQKLIEHSEFCVPGDIWDYINRVFKKPIEGRFSLLELQTMTIDDKRLFPTLNDFLSSFNNAKGAMQTIALLDAFGRNELFRKFIEIEDEEIAKARYDALFSTTRTVVAPEVHQSQTPKRSRDHLDAIFPLLK